TGNPTARGAGIFRVRRFCRNGSLLNRTRAVRRVRPVPWDSPGLRYVTRAALCSRLTEHVTLEVRRGRFWQLADEFHGAWILVRSDSALHVLLQLACERVASGVTCARHDERLDDLAALLVARTDHRTLPHRRMLQQRGLYFRPGDVVTARDDHVVGARLEPEVAILVDVVAIASDVPTVLDIFELTRIVQVATAARAFDGQPSRVRARQRAALIVEHARLVAGQRLAGCAGTDVIALGRDEDVDHLRRTDAVDDGNHRGVLPRV